MGIRLARELEQKQTLLSDTEVTEYINRIGQNLAANSDAKGPIVIKVLQSNEVNCINFPGFLYVTTGLIAAAGNEAELAGAMAQGIAHMAAHHTARMQTRMDRAQILLLPPNLRFPRGFTEEADYLVSNTCTRPVMIRTRS